MSSEGMPTVRLSGSYVRWEYRVALIDVSGLFNPNINVDEIGQYFNGIGDEGWELVTVVDVNRGNGATSALLAILKRQRQD
ncbi:MAG TPA: DUF4177 domain-containing protein [Herpetosiphonaceae bacterium]|nr:DUF4177 domain-containing protein [Herpetosiphonaceae bacterium]